MPFLIHHLTSISYYFFTFITSLLKGKHNPHLTNFNFLKLCMLSIISKAFLHSFIFFFLSFIAFEAYFFPFMSSLVSANMHRKICKHSKTIPRILPSWALSSTLDDTLGFSSPLHPSSYTTGRLSLRRAR